MKNEDVISLARQTLDQGLYFGRGKVTRAIDTELVVFADKLTRPLEAKIVALEERLKLIHKTTSCDITRSLVRVEEIECGLTCRT